MEETGKSNQVELKSLAELQQIISEKITGFCELNGDKEIFQPVNYIMQLGGKRLRPALCLMATNVFCDNIDGAVYPALAIEVFHNFSLMHDDIMDRAPIRRGLPTVHKKWNDNVAILSGDAMMIQSYQLLMKTNPEVFPDVMHVFNEVAIDVCEGQQLDMNFESRVSVSVAEYEEMIRLKTSVLLAGAMKIGAIIGGADSVAQKAMFDFGVELGMSFQLWDDYLDAFGDGKLTGKLVGGDILADKKTFLRLRCMELASEEEKKVLLANNSVNLNDPGSRVKSVVDLYSKLGVDEELKKEAERRHQKALSILNDLKVPVKRKMQLQLLAEQLLNRTN
jgi:geranylgeranyl diphosphate synthase type II